MKISPYLTYSDRRDKSAAQRPFPRAPRPAPRASSRAFSRLDLLVIIGVVFFLGAWFAFARFGERARIKHCAYNLMTLGRAMQSYTDEHNDEIPAAYIDLGTNRVSWDTRLLPYLSPGLRPTTSQYEQRQQELALAHWVFCPSDPLLHSGTPRSYAMAEHNMSLDDWPPRWDSSSGPGLFWDAFWTTNVLTSEEAQAATQNPDLLPKIRRSDIPVPADTLLLTEYIHRDNSFQGLGYARVGGVGDQRVSFNGDSHSFHYGKFNYLMVDGHVEWLEGAMTGGENGRGGIWTLRAGD